MMGGIYLSAEAQCGNHTPVANKRQVHQIARIAHGQATGTLTVAEARWLKKEQRHIYRVKRRAKADGIVTAAERAVIRNKQVRADRHIRRQKHDAQHRF